MVTLRRLRASAGITSVSWGLIDQGFSSATNLGLSVLAGRAAGPGGLGVVYLGFSVYLMILTLQRALVTDPLVVASARHSAEERASSARRALAIVITAAVVSSGILLVIGLLIPAPDGLGLVVFVPWLGGALVQDFWRAILFRDGRGAAAALNDGLWAAVMVLTIPLVRVGHSPWILVLTWGAGAVAGGALGFVQTRLRPAGVRASLHWWAGNAWPLARWLAAESLLVLMQYQLVVFGLVAILGAADVGGLRSVQALFTPMTLLNQALAFPGLPMLTKLSGTSRRLARARALRLSALAVGLVLAYMVAVTLFPHHVLGVLFGSAFDRFDDLILPVALTQLLSAGFLGFYILLKAEARGRAIVLNRAIGATSAVVLTITFALTSGLTAAVWGTAIAAVIGAVSLAVLTLVPTRRPDPALTAASTVNPLPGQSAD